MKYVGVFSVACLGVFLSGQVTHAQKANEWSLSEREKAPLGLEYRVGEISVRPPKGFTLAQTGDPSERSYVWLAKPIVAGQPVTGFVITTIELNGDDRKQLAKMSAENIASIYTKNFFKTWHDIKQSPWSTGTINGMRFVRSTWWASNKSNVKAHGFFYVTIYKGIPYICSAVEPDTGKSTIILRTSDQSSRSCKPMK